MVMDKRKNIMGKNLRASIRNSLGRYLAITGIIALGAAMFVGLRTTKSDMVATGQQYMDAQNMFDLRLLGTYGWSESDVAAIAQIDGVQDAEGVRALDAIVRRGEAAEAVYKIYAIPEQVNRVCLQGGRMPQSPDECLMDGHYFTEEMLGTTVTISEENEQSTRDSFRCHTLTIVGSVSTPLFMDMTRGSTSIGNGSVAGYLYVPADCFDMDYYSEVDITIAGDSAVYTDEYHDAMEQFADAVKPQLQPLADARYETVRAEAEESYADGLREYRSGLAEYESGKRDAEAELESAREELLDGERQLAENRALIEDGERQLAEGYETLNGSSTAIITSRQTLAEAKAEAYAQISQASGELLKNYKDVSSGLRQVESGLTQIDTGLAQLDAGITQLETGLQQLAVTRALMDTMLQVLDTSIEVAQKTLEQAKTDGTLDADTIARLEQRLAELIARRDGYAEQYQTMVDSEAVYTSQLADLKGQREELAAQRETLAAQQTTLQQALDTINDGFLELDTKQKEADNEFAAAEAQLAAGQGQIDLGRITLEEKERELTAGKAALEEAEKTLADGWIEYRAGREKAQRELSQAQLSLCAARQELDDARAIIDAFEAPEVYALARTTNVGYLALDNNSDIVAGVARVFPAFFLLVAALVCVTTMTRMVEEERTQIGTLKALGYRSGEIIAKYLAYAGSAALIGCTLGVLLGSVVFPVILWEAYGIILNLTPHIRLLFNWKLCIPVVLAYTAVSLLVTWDSCRLALREVPAELIRPKPPTSGKQIFLEKLPFWKRIGFLNKVMLRNIFRYRQRLLMMLVGIGGCTALLLTGFGVGDSIKNIVSYQFDEVTRYDIEVRFSEGQSAAQQRAFCEEIGRYVDQIGFLYQTSVEADYGSRTMDVTLLAADGEITDFVDFHRGSQELTMPEKNEAIFSVGTAEKMGFHIGDTVTLRTSDMQMLTVTVSAIFDNHVYNYALVSPETLAEQWGAAPVSQMAYINVGDGQDAHYAGTRISRQDDVMNVTVLSDLADQVGNMLEAMDLVIATVVVCAGALAVIVLYNLTNINITERLREIATIKVLGFTEAESAAYVFKENLLLSAMGAVVGLAGGKFLLDFVMSQIRIDMVWFESRLMPQSFVLAIVLTMLAACVVDFVLYFKLNRINMAEALKSVE